jgi:hypothetical protein
MTKFNKTMPMILSAIAAISIGGAQAVLADHDDWNGHDGDHGRTVQFQNNNGWNNYHNNNVRYQNDRYNNHHPRTVKHEIRHLVNNL